MKPSEIELAKTQVLLDRYTAVQNNIDNLESLLVQAKNERSIIYNELYQMRGMRTGFVQINGLDSRLEISNGRIEINVPEYVPVDDYKRKV